MVEIDLQRRNRNSKQFIFVAKFLKLFYVWLIFLLLSTDLPRLLNVATPLSLGVSPNKVLPLRPRLAGGLMIAVEVFKKQKDAAALYFPLVESFGHLRVESEGSNYGCQR